MSGTDSDLDFESADEDAEFASKVSSESKPLNPVPKELSDAPSTTELNSTSDSIPVEKPSNKEDESSGIPEVIKSEITETPENPEKDNQNISKPESVQKNISKSENEENVKLTEHIPDTTETCDAINSNARELKPEVETTDSDSHHEKRRVVLRIEKKKQQKEAYIEREKPSDLINILSDATDRKQSWGFSSWGSSLLSSAASSVSTFSSQVTQGIGTVLDTVESSLGAPPPEELASSLKEKKEKESNPTIKDESVKSDSDVTAGLLPDMTSWTKVFENTGSKVIMGGLDTLELIGKKTMDMLTEGDPGMRKKRAMFSDGSNLSEVFREAKARADEQDRNGSSEEADNVHYSQIFDEKQGLVHLEALEILSQQNEMKLQRLLMRYSRNTEVKKRLEEIISICDNIPSLDDTTDYENFEDFEAVFKNHTLELTLPLNVDPIINTQKQIGDTIKKYENLSRDDPALPKEVFQSAVCSLAEFTAKCIETFHKVAELILVQPSLESDLEQCATNLTGLTTVMCIETHNLSSRYHKCLESMSDHCQDEAGSKRDITILATNLYVEAANSNKYIQDAYQMLAPILQVCLLESLE